MNSVSTERRIRILHLLARGSSIRAAEEVTKTHRDTISRLLVEAGEACQGFLDATLRNLRAEHWQIDESWTFCRKKERHLTPEERDTGVLGDQYLFLALGTKSKLVPSFLVGRRDEANARLFMRDLAGRLSFTGKRHRLSTDGWYAYPFAVDQAFGDKVDHGVIVKEHPTSTTVRIARRNVSGHGDDSRICTSHVERRNLTIRTFMERYTRKSLAFSKKFENLQAAVAVHMAYYNFCWKPKTIKMTPAMAANIVSEAWTFQQLLVRVGVVAPPRIWS